MSIQLPGMYGLIVRRSPRTTAPLEEERAGRPGLHAWRNEDDHLVGLTMAMSYDDLQAACERWTARGLQEGVDFVKTVSLDGVIGPLPSWLQEDAGEGNAFSMPGTGAAPRAVPRPTAEQRMAAEQQARERIRVEEERTRIQLSDAVADRRWPNLTHEVASEFLGECWALVHFVEGCRLGGAARTWVESNFPRKTWHIRVVNGYTDELKRCLTEYYRAEAKDKDSALLRVRRRAGEYVAALELGAGMGTVDLACFEEWLSRAGRDLNRQVGTVPMPESRT